MKLGEYWENYKKLIKEKISGDRIHSSSKPPIKNAQWFGFIVLIMFFGIFGLWSVFAPLESAAVASGKIIIANNRKTIQHLEGGIVKNIFVREGSLVKAGDPLIEIENTEAKATHTSFHTQLNDLYAKEARLNAERDQEQTIKFPEFLLKQKNNLEVQKIMHTEKILFESDKQTLMGQLEILQQRIEQLKKQIEGQKAQVASNDEQLKFIQEELKAVEILDRKKLIEKTRLWALLREKARLEGNRGEILGSIAEAEQKIGETQQQIITLKDETQKEILKELDETEAKLAEIKQKEIAAADVLRRTVILSPLSGTVMGLQEHTIGGVIGPGKAIMDIVPVQDELIIEAKVNPLDIDVLHTGLKAKVQLVAYKRRNTPWLDGVVTQVSADIFQDPDSHTSYYTARILISANDLKKLKNIALYPGMPVSVMIITEKRTPFDYFITPIKDSFTKAFREE